MTRLTRRKRSIALRRALAAFPAVLPSSRTGLHFTAHLTATLTSPLPSTADPEELADAIRLAVRSAAASAVRHEDPLDLPAAQDACSRELRRNRPLDAFPDIIFNAKAQVHLSDDVQVAAHHLQTARRTQDIEDTLHRQHTASLASELAHPAGLLAWWLQHPEVSLTNHPKKEDLNEISQRLQDYPQATADRPLEIQLLAVLQHFLSEFPHSAQKEMLLTLLANGMRAARQPGHARTVENIRDGQTIESTAEPQT